MFDYIKRKTKGGNNMNLIRKVYATITHKRNKKNHETTRPKFSFSAVVAGFLISATVFSTGVVTPAFAAETVNICDGIQVNLNVDGENTNEVVIGDSVIRFEANGEVTKIEDGKIEYIEKRTYDDALKTAVASTSQFAELVQSGKVDLVTVKRTLDALRESEQLFNEDANNKLSDYDCLALNTIIETYGSPYLEGVPTYAGGITDSRADLLSDVTVIATNFLQSNGGVVAGGGNDLIGKLKQEAPTPSPTPEIVLSQGMANFKTSDANMKHYNDVYQSAWYYDEVTQSSKLGIVVGDDYGNFNPDANLSYGEALTLAARVNAIYHNRQAELEKMAEAQKASGKHWATGYEDYAYSNGILEPSNDKSEPSREGLSLDMPCSRYIMAQLFANALPDSEYTAINDWSLSPDTSAWSYLSPYLGGATPSLKKLFLSGIMIGDDTGFRGNDSITRAETACIVNRIAVPTNRKTVIDTTQFDYAKYNDPAIRNYLENLRSDPEYGHGAPKRNGISSADTVHCMMANKLGINSYSTKKLPSYKDACAGDILYITGDPVYHGGYYGVLILERKEDSITIIDFNLNGKVLYGRTLTFDQLAQCKSVEVQRNY